MASVGALHLHSKIAQSSCPHSGAQVDRLVHNPVLACKGAVGGMAVTEQQGLRIEPGHQVAVELRSGECAAARDGIDRALLAVARDQDAVQSSTVQFKTSLYLRLTAPSVTPSRRVCKASPQRPPYRVPDSVHHYVISCAQYELFHPHKPRLACQYWFSHRISE